MTLLKAEPPEAVHSMDELFALAHAMEQEAARRYGELARDMREHGETALAGVFDHLAEMERSHVEMVDSWSERRSGHRPDPAAVRWEIPETFDTESVGDLAASRLATPYRALTIAVQNEERAFTFWSYVAARAEDGSVRDAAETMAREELEHVALLRRERRQAYHAERRKADAGEGRAGAAELLSGSAALEARLGDLLDRLATESDASARERLQPLVVDARRTSAELSQGVAMVGDRSPIEAARADDLMQLAERLVERYLEAADRARDEFLLGQAQSCARAAIVRLRLLRDLVKRVDR